MAMTSFSEPLSARRPLTLQFLTFLRYTFPFPLSACSCRADDGEHCTCSERSPSRKGNNEQFNSFKGIVMPIRLYSGAPLS